MCDLVHQVIVLIHSILGGLSFMLFSCKFMCMIRFIRLTAMIRFIRLNNSVYQVNCIDYTVLPVIHAASLCMFFNRVVWGQWPHASSTC